MSRYSVAFSKTTGAAAGPMLDIRPASAKDARLWELGVFLETAVAGTIGLVRSTNAGTTPGGAVVPVSEDYSNTRTCTVNCYTTYGTEPTQATVYMRRAVLPGSIGSGIIWTFPEGIVIPTSTDTATANGFMLRQLSSLAVTYSIYATIEE